MEQPQNNNIENLKNDFNTAIEGFAPLAVGQMNYRVLRGMLEKGTFTDEQTNARLKQDVENAENKYNLAVIASKKLLDGAENKEEATDLIYTKLNELFGPYDQENRDDFVKKVILQLVKK